MRVYMQHRTLGRTGLSISEIGFGAWGIGGEMWQGATDTESMAALHRAADLGMNFIDTALAYGKGHSEMLVGRFVKERREPIVVASKIPPMNNTWPARPGSRLSEVFPYKYIVESTERSLRNLGLETIDIQQLHVWLDEWTDLPEWFEAVSQLKEQGKIRFFGISINDHQPESALRVGASGKVDTFQVIYNIFDQSPADKLFPLCLDAGIGIIVRVPFDEGALTGSITPATSFPRGDFRNGYFRGNRKLEVQERVDKLRPLLGKDASTLPELALRFCLNSAAVSTVIPGMRTTRHAEENCAVSDGRRLTPALAKQLRAHRWEKNYYGNPAE
jgi:aryl-alcohol dehydrogenase-like predicted oxidoreductase